MRDIMGTGDHLVVLSRRLNGEPIAAAFPETAAVDRSKEVILQGRKMPRSEALDEAKKLNDHPERIEKILRTELKPRGGEGERLL